MRLDPKMWRRLVVASLSVVAATTAVHSGTQANPEVRIADPGCRKLVAACQSIRRNEDRVEAELARLHLSLSQFARDRKSVAANREAFAALDRALSMPIVIPRLDWIESERTFRYSRRGAILLAASETVSFAEGDHAKAVQSLLDGLHLAGLLRRNNTGIELMSGSCQNLVLKPVAKNLGRLSLADCRNILRAVRTQLARPVAWEEMAEGDNQEDHELVVDIAHRMLKDLVARAKQHPEYGVGSDPAPADKTLDELIKKSDRLRGATYHAVAVELGKPFWKRKTVPYPPKDDLLTQVLVEVMGQFGGFSATNLYDAVTAREARLRLLGVHVAIAAYRLEHHTLPGSLSMLNVPGLATDPFSGKPFVYRLVGRTGYMLYSVGPEMRDHGGKPAKDPAKGDVFLLRDGSR